jgi:VanZ family protein
MNYRGGPGVRDNRGLFGSPGIWTAAMISYAAFIFYLSSLPKPPIPNLTIPFRDKLFHIAEYGIMGFLAGGMVSSMRGKHLKKSDPLGILMPLLICIGYGVMDEIHQLFVPGRDFEAADLLADGLGAALALLIGPRVYARIIIWTSLLIIPTIPIAGRAFALEGSSAILIPMDEAQTDHLRAYGVTYHALSLGLKSEWLLSYRGGSFLIQASKDVEEVARRRGVAFEVIDRERMNAIYREIEEGNMRALPLEKAPSIAVYAPPTNEPWDDAVTLVLTYAQIPYKVIWDEDVLKEDLKRYDWIHLHHEDFTGQFGKFHMYELSEWYRRNKELLEETARRLGFDSVASCKKAVAEKLRKFVLEGGSLFAMCSATETLDIALAAHDTDIVPEKFDGTPADPDANKKLDFDHTFAFKDFKVFTDPNTFLFSDIDVKVDEILGRSEEETFSLFEFSAKEDPIPTALTQNHVRRIRGFMGQTTAFNKDRIKDNVVILGEDDDPRLNAAKYICGTLGEGIFSFYGGHDPEDYRHFLGDPPTNLSFFKNSPGYRLILNNVLIPAAKKIRRKT